MGSDLYNNLIRYFIIHLKSLRVVSHLFLPQSSHYPLSLYVQSVEPLEDEALLRYYSTEWLRYTTGANYINRLFTYLNRHWVKRERDEGRKAVYPVYTVRFVLLVLAIALSIRSAHAFFYYIYFVGQTVVLLIIALMLLLTPCRTSPLSRKCIGRSSLDDL